MDIPEIITKIFSYLSYKDVRNMSTVSKIVSHTYRILLLRYSNVSNRLENIFRDNYEDIITNMKKTNSFVSGSFVLESLHVKNFENSDIDIYCGCNHIVKLSFLGKKLRNQHTILRDRIIFLEHIKELMRELNIIRTLIKPYTENNEKTISLIIKEKVINIVKKIIQDIIVFNNIIYNEDRTIFLIYQFLKEESNQDLINRVNRDIINNVKNCISFYNLVDELLKVYNVEYSCPFILYMEKCFVDKETLEETQYGTTNYVKSYCYIGKRIQLIHHNVYVDSPEDVTETFYGTLVMNYWTPKEPSKIYCGYPKLTLNSENLILYTFKNTIHNNYRTHRILQSSKEDLVDNGILLNTINKLIYIKIIHTYSNIMYYQYTVLHECYSRKSMINYIYYQISHIKKKDVNLDYLINNYQHQYYEASSFMNTLSYDTMFDKDSVKQYILDTRNLIDEFIAFNPIKDEFSDPRIISDKETLYETLISDVIEVFGENITVRTFIEEIAILVDKTEISFFVYIISNILIKNFSFLDNEKLYKDMVDMKKTLPPAIMESYSFYEKFSQCMSMCNKIVYDLKVIRAMNKYNKRNNKNLMFNYRSRPFCPEKYLMNHSRTSIISNIFDENAVDIKGLIMNGKYNKYRKESAKIYNNNDKYHAMTIYKN
ncbi:hypothetical protein HDU92_008453 [Lobulomyces angularis]|nr:hypothetical protein HDU92_008453 [Lobulomyces angularis]